MEVSKKATLDVVKPIRVKPSFKHEIMRSPGGESIKVCFNCGTCTSSCPIARFNGSFRPRHIIQMTLLGMRSKVLSSDNLWLCAACFTCTDRCPQGVEVANVLRVLRNIAVQEGFIPSVYREQASSILETGYAYKITRSQIQRREKAGLPSLPKADLKDLAKLAEVTGFSKITEEERTENE